MHEHIAIKPVADLHTTAGVIGKIVGADFEKDESGFYEEFPAYVAESQGITYELLGHPQPEYDIRQFTKDEFELIISSANSHRFKEKVDELMKRLPVEGGVACRILD